MRGMTIFQKPSYREIRPMRGRPMRGPPVLDWWHLQTPLLFSIWEMQIQGVPA